MNEILIEAKLENTDSVVSFVREQLNGCSQKTINQISIVVEEIFTNIARYAYQPIGSAIVRVAVDDVITIEFEDSGMAYDPLAKEDPDITLAAEEREIGGLGIFMVKKMMDSVEYRRMDSKNILTIRKCR